MQDISLSETAYLLVGIVDCGMLSRGGRAGSFEAHRTCRRLNTRALKQGVFLIGQPANLAGDGSE